MQTFVIRGVIDGQQRYLGIDALGPYWPDRLGYAEPIPSVEQAQAIIAQLRMHGLLKNDQVVEICTLTAEPIDTICNIPDREPYERSVSEIGSQDPGGK